MNQRLLQFRPKSFIIVQPRPFLQQQNLFISSYNKQTQKREEFEDLLPEEAENRRAILQGIKNAKQAASKDWDLKECPFCKKPHNNDPTNLYKLRVFSSLQGYKCLRCNSSGSWSSLMQALEADDKKPKIELAGYYFNDPASTSAKLPDQIQAKSYSSTLMDLAWTDKNNSHPCIEFLKNRKLTREVCEVYKVGYGMFRFQDDKGGFQNFGCVTFPWLGRDGEFGVDANGVPDDPKDEYKVIRTKIRGLENKHMQRTVPAGGIRGFFGWHTIPDDCETIILTEGEFDAMAVYQETKNPTLSVPNGASSFPADLIPALKRFKKIILWYDDDQPGQEGCERTAQKLGLSRCSVVKITSELLQKASSSVNQEAEISKKRPKDANDLLKAGYDLNVFLDAAEPMRHDKIVGFKDLREEVRMELIDPRVKLGLASRPFPTFTKILGGHRRGELTIVTGPTGSGKTTFLSQLSIDYCLQGIPTLWGSFEIKNARLISMMLKQMAYSGGLNWRGTPPPDDQYGGALNRTRNVIDFGNEIIFNSHADEYQSLDMYFLKYFGSTGLDDVIDALDHAVNQHDIQHIIIDNLQFMISGASGERKGIITNKFDLQDRALDQFRGLATKRNVHITLVMHPRKEPPGAPLSLESIGGTAKASQEADNVVIIQRAMDGQKTIEVKKNRFSGDLGAISVGFNREAKTFRDLLAHGDN